MKRCVWCCAPAPRGARFTAGWRNGGAEQLGQGRSARAWAVPRRAQDPSGVFGGHEGWEEWDTFGHVLSITLVGRGSLLVTSIPVELPVAVSTFLPHNLALFPVGQVVVVSSSWQCSGGSLDQGFPHPWSTRCHLSQVFHLSPSLHLCQWREGLSGDAALAVPQDFSSQITGLLGNSSDWSPLGFQTFHLHHYL